MRLRTGISLLQTAFKERCGKLPWVRDAAEFMMISGVGCRLGNARTKSPPQAQKIAVGRREYFVFRTRDSARPATLQLALMSGAIAPPTADATAHYMKEYPP